MFHCLTVDDPASVVRIARECRFEISGEQMVLNGVPLEGIHNETIDRWSSIHSRIIEVRKTVNSRIREIVDDRDFIVMGRDIGTIVFPDAPLKIYLDASIQARAARRHRQERDDSGGARLEPEQIRRQIEERDTFDRAKPYGKLEQAHDAIYIDTSDLTIDKVCDRVIREILRVFEKINQSGA